MTPEPSESATPAWAMTFGDLMSLMLVFFVLLASFATLDARRFEALSRSLQAGFGNGGDGELILVGRPDAHLAPLTLGDAAARAPDVEAARAAQLRMAVQQRRLERVLEIEATPRGVVLRAPAQLLFGPGGDELRGEALPLLHEIAGLLQDLPGAVSIDGHADAEAAGADGFALSAARALAALRHLVEVEGMDAQRLRATAFGAVRPLFANTGPLARERNRRVEFVLLRDAAEGDLREPAALGTQATSGDRKVR
jgi:chemotaxis protein MotB